MLLIFVSVASIPALSGFGNLNFSGHAVDVEALKAKQIISWGVESVNAPALWPEVTGKGVKVAILDSGFNYSHPDFGENIREGYNAIEPGKPAEDDNGHGTLMCGVIAARNNSFGIAGVAPDVELYPVKVLDKYGEGDVSDIAEGVDWCVEKNIQVINMSFAIEKDMPLLRSAVEKAVKAGIIVVASSCNISGGKVGYPASYEDVISVMAVDRRLKTDDYAPKGKIDFSAPGIGVLSTAGNGGYEESRGTSFAASYVTGLIALVLQSPQKFGLPEGGDCTRDDVYNILKDFSKDLGEKGKDSTYGEGFVCFGNKK